MPNYCNLPLFAGEGEVNAVVETPRGSRAKLAYEPKLESFVLRKSLLTGLTYPHDWGFLPSTRADDGDPLDVTIIHDAATFPGLVVVCRVIGILKIEQTSKARSERNDRVFVVPTRSHAARALNDVADLSQPFREELQKFFAATEELEDTTLDFLGWEGPQAALQAIAETQKNFVKT